MYVYLLHSYAQLSSSVVIVIVVTQATSFFRNDFFKAETHDATNRYNTSSRQVASSALILRQVTAALVHAIDFGREEM